MKKSCLLIAMLILLSPLASSGAQDSPSLIVRGALNCQTGAVRFSSGVLGDRQFPSVAAAMGALVNKKAIAGSESQELKDCLQHICKLQGPTARHKGGGEGSLDNKANVNKPGLLLEGIVGKDIQFSLLSFSTYKSLEEYVDRQRRAPSRRGIRGASSFISSFAGGSFAQACTPITQRCMFCPPKFYCKIPRSE